MEQFERAKRYFDRVASIYEGIFSSSGHNEYLCDDVISFFIHCYHIRDWIIHSNLSGLTSKYIDDYINQHQALKICADLANGAKHCKLTRSMRTNHQPQICEQQRHTSTWYIGSGGGEVMRCKYIISYGEELLDALDLAKECIALWQCFIDGSTKRSELVVQDMCQDVSG